MNEPTMLYRCPGPQTFEGVSCETTVVDAGEVDAKLAEGWRRNWIDAAGAKIQANEAQLADIGRQLDEAAPPKRGRRAS